MQDKGQEHVAGVVPQAMGKKNTTTCKKCGHENDFSVNQWRRVCFKCGMHITMPWAKVERAKRDGVPPACFTCMDRGLVFYESQEAGVLYMFVALCTCSAAPKADYPLVTEINNIGSLSRIEHDNRREWEDKHGKVPVVLLENMDEVNDEPLPFKGHELTP